MRYVLMLYLLSIIVLGSVVAMIIAAFLILKFIFLPIAIFLAIGIAMILFAIWPRLPGLPKNVLEEKKLPEFSRRIKQILDRTEAESLRYFISEDYDVSIVTFPMPFKAHYYLNLGLPLVLELSEEELMALVEFEIFRVKNCSLESSYLIKSSLGILDGWISILQPSGSVHQSEVIPQTYREAKGKQVDWLSTFGFSAVGDLIKGIIAFIPESIRVLVLKNLDSYKRVNDQTFNLKTSSMLEQALAKKSLRHDFAGKVQKAALMSAPELIFKSSQERVLFNGEFDQFRRPIAEKLCDQYMASIS